MIYRHKFLRRTKNRRSDPSEIEHLISKENFAIPKIWLPSASISIDLSILRSHLRDKSFAWRRKSTVSTAGSTISEQGFACGRSDSATAPNGRRSSAGTLRPFRSAARHGVGPDRAYPTVCHSGFPLKQQGMGGVASATNLEQAAGRAPQGKRLRRVITTLDCRPPPPPDCRKRR